MPEFPSWRSYQHFAATVTRDWRYRHPPAVATFLETVLATSGDKVEVVPAGAVAFRAQLDHDMQPQTIGDGLTEDFPAPCGPERMKPLRGKAREGRANPKGIPCLYVGTHEKTAVAEVRPWIGAHISVAQLKMLREVRVVNCTTDDRKMPIHFQEPDAAKRLAAVWRDIDRAFAEPISPTDDVADYVPTQILAETFRAAGLDGVAYRSSVGEGTT